MICYDCRWAGLCLCIRKKGEEGHQFAMSQKNRSALAKLWWICSYVQSTFPSPKVQDGELRYGGAKIALNSQRLVSCVNKWQSNFLTLTLTLNGNMEGDNSVKNVLKPSYGSHSHPWIPAYQWIRFFAPYLRAQSWFPNFSWRWALKPPTLGLHHHFQMNY